MNNHKSTIDLILTNKPRSYQITNVTETGVSDCHKLILTFMKSYISRLKPKNVHYRSYKNLMKKNFSLTLRKRIFLLKQVIRTSPNKCFLKYCEYTCTSLKENP